MINEYITRSYYSGLDENYNTMSSNKGYIGKNEEILFVLFEIKMDMCVWLSNIYCWFSCTLTFSLGFLWIGRGHNHFWPIMLLILVIINNIYAGVWYINSLDKIGEEAIDKKPNLVWKMMIMLLFISFTISIVLMPLMIYKPADKYNNKMINSTGYFSSSVFVPNCKNNTDYPCIVNCNYYEEFDHMKKVPKCDNILIHSCNLNNITCCYDDNHIIKSGQSCQIQVVQCNAYRGKYYARRTQTGTDCTAYFRLSKVYWGIPKYKVGWDTIFFVIFTGFGLCIFLFSFMSNMIPKCKSKEVLHEAPISLSE